MCYIFISDSIKLYILFACINPNKMFEANFHSFTLNISHFLIVTIMPDLPYQLYFKNEGTQLH